MSPKRARDQTREAARASSLEAYAVAIRELNDAELAAEYRPRDLLDDVRAVLDAETARRKKGDQLCA